MKRFDVLLLLILLLPSMGMATTLFEVDDVFSKSRVYRKDQKGQTVNVPVSRYYPRNKRSALYKVLKQAQILTAHVSFMGRDGIRYKQHNWNAGSDRANLKRGIDCSRAIWFAFTRAGVPYNSKNRYLATDQMWRKDSKMKRYFRSCSITNLNHLRLGDVLVYRGGGKGHTVMVLDPKPKKKYAWGSHGWDKSGRRDTGVEVQKVVSRNGWGSWDKGSMKLKACWRHKDFTKQPIISPSSLIPINKLGQYPETKKRWLSNADLKDKTRYALWIMRNEMFARYGYRFKNRELTDHFKGKFQSKNTDSSATTIFYSQFSDLERSNATFIYQYERNRIAENPKPCNLSSNYNYDYAKRRLTYPDIVGKSKQELRIMRNEIYARHGYIFGSYDLQTYFEKKSWYCPKTKNDTDLYHNSFTQIERDNVDFIKSYE
ncbi:protein containing caspase domain [Beggiatoa sp. PS]|nr:protein containing caspase domain [Beggiatoa sp. PS]